MRSEHIEDELCALRVRAHYLRTQLRHARLNEQHLKDKVYMFVQWRRATERVDELTQLVSDATRAIKSLTAALAVRKKSRAPSILNVGNSDARDSTLKPARVMRAVEEMLELDW